MKEGRFSTQFLDYLSCADPKKGEKKVCEGKILRLFLLFYLFYFLLFSGEGLQMPSGVPKGENCQVDMDSKAGDLFTAEDAHPTGTGGAGILSKYESQFCFF